MANKKFGLKEVFDAVIYDIVTNKPVVNFDSLKVSTIEVGAESTSATGGRGNSKLITWDFNKTATLNMTDALLTTKSFELLTGNAVKQGNATIYMRQNTQWDTSGAKPVNKGSLYPLTASGAGTVELAYVPLETAANILVYDATDDCGTALTPGTLEGKMLTNVEWANKKLVVYYTFTAADATTFLITSDKFPGSYKLIGSTVVRNADTKQDEAFQIQINNLKFNSNFTLTMQAEGDPSTFDMTAEILREGSNSKMITMVQY